MDNLELLGKLLVASSSILEHNFIRSVVLVVDHDSRGALGLTLNHPMPGGISSKNPLYRGGPVESDRRSLLHTSQSLASSTAIIDGVFFEPSDELISDLAEQDITYRRFTGYAGWGTGQLEYEIRRNSWIVLNATAELIFAAAGPEFWTRCLVEKGGLYRHFARTHKNILLN